MRIGIDCRMYSTRFTGIGRYVYELTKNLFEIDRENEYFLFFNNPEHSKFSPPKSAANRVHKILVNAPHYSIQEQTKFLSLLNKHKLDLMHFTHFNAPILYKKPSIVTIHDLTLSFFPGKKMTSFLHRAGYHITIKSAVNNAKRVIAVSNNTKKDLQDILKIPDEKIDVIYEGVDQSFSQLSESQLTSVDNAESDRSKPDNMQITKPFLLYTGVWRSHKNLQNLIKAFHILKTEYNFQGSLVITGRPDPVYSKEVMGETLSLKLENDVVFTGMVSEDKLIQLYNQAEVYVFPSLYEGFGLSPLEAMQCGTPVAASNASCIPEVCGEENALFFDPRNPRDMAEKVFRILSEKSLKEELVKNGLEHVKKFSWEKMAKDTFKVYNSVLKTDYK